MAHHPKTQKARRQLLRYIESVVAAGDREGCARVLGAIAERGGGGGAPQKPRLSAAAGGQGNGGDGELT